MIRTSVSVGLALATLVSCRRAEEGVRPVPAEQKAAAPTEAVPAECPPDVETPLPVKLPEYVTRIAKAELYDRAVVDSGSDIVAAPPDDLATMQAYPTTRIRGPAVAGTSVTILAAKKTYRVGEELRVLHVVQIDVPGQEVFVMGPKPVTGEYLDDVLVTPKVPSWGAFTTSVYDGAVLKSPWADTNYEITRYRLTTPGLHRVQWRTGTVSSNVLCVRVLP